MIMRQQSIWADQSLIRTQSRGFQKGGRKLVIKQSQAFKISGDKGKTDNTPIAHKPFKKFSFDRSVNRGKLFQPLDVFGENPRISLSLSRNDPYVPRNPPDFAEVF